MLQLPRLLHVPPIFEPQFLTQSHSFLVQGQPWECHSIFRVIWGIFSICGTMTLDNLMVPCEPFGKCAWVACFRSIRKMKWIRVFRKCVLHGSMLSMNRFIIHHHLFVPKWMAYSLDRHAKCCSHASCTSKSLKTRWNRSNCIAAKANGGGSDSMGQRSHRFGSPFCVGTANGRRA